jgi:hypothetical protein
VKLSRGRATVKGTFSFFSQETCPDALQPNKTLAQRCSGRHGLVFVPLMPESMPEQESAGFVFIDGSDR